MTTTKKNEDVFMVKVELVWRDYENNYEHKSKVRQFEGKSKAEVYGYIKYYCLAFGMCNCIHIGEGWGNTDSKPDMDSPEVKGTLIEDTVISEEPGLLL